MTPTNTATVSVADSKKSDRNTKIGRVVSTKMTKTIIVETTRQRAHALYKRVISRSKRFYAHDEEGKARVGDFVEIEETRPMSKLKRWRLKNIIQRSALVEEPAAGSEKTQSAKRGSAKSGSVKKEIAS